MQVLAGERVGPLDQRVVHEGHLVLHLPDRQGRPRAGHLVDQALVPLRRVGHGPHPEGLSVGHLLVPRAQVDLAAGLQRGQARLVPLGRVDLDLQGRLLAVGQAAVGRRVAHLVAQGRVVRQLQRPQNPVVDSLAVCLVAGVHHHPRGLAAVFLVVEVLRHGLAVDSLEAVVAPVGLEAGADDRPGVCNQWGLGFYNAPQ